MPWNESYTCLAGKNVIVTGANSGIGYYTALDFAKRGARVILACRNEEKAEEARAKIISATNNPNVIYKLIDLFSLKSVREFAEDINTTEDHLDILVNNAGAGGLGNETTSDGLQITMQVNYFSMFLLTHLLLDKLKKSAPSRIVNVTSMAANFAQLNIEKFNDFPDGNVAWADTLTYNNSKLCVIFFTTELAKKLYGTGVTVNALHPGFVNTELFRRMPPLMKKIFMKIADLCFKTAEEGARTSVYVAVSKELEGVSGKMFENCRQIQLYKKARDENLARIVWQKSEELTQLSDGEKIKEFYENINLIYT